MKNVRIELQGAMMRLNGRGHDKARAPAPNPVNIPGCASSPDRNEPDRVIRTSKYIC